MKIVQVQTQAEAGGAQRISDMVGEGLRAKGHEVRTVFMYRKTAAYDGDPFADFVLGERPRGLVDQMRASFGLFRHLRKAEPDAVISYQHYGNIFGTIGGRLAGARRVIANQSGAPQTRGVMGLLTRIDRLMGAAGLYHFSVVNSGWTEAQFARYPEAYRRRIRRIDHGIPAPRAACGKAEARQAFGLPEDAWLAVSTGRLSRQKNHIALAGALCRLDDLHIAIAGAGPERDALAAFAREHHVSDRLHLIGEIPAERVFDFLAAGDVFVFPSENETFGLSAAEAAIAGVPVVANGLPVLREVLCTDEGEHAAVFADPADPENIAKAIIEIMTRPDLARQLGAAGRRLAERYSPGAMCAAYERLLA